MKSILENVIQLGKKLQMKIICEGIETNAQEKLLAELGCEFGQGFLHSEMKAESEFFAGEK